MSTPPASAGPDAFAASRERLETILGWLDGDQTSGLDHGDLERQLDVHGRRLLRQLLQDHVDLRAVRESRVNVVDAGGVRRTRVETGHTRQLASIFGEVTVTRLAYRGLGAANLHPGDAVLNLPPQKHSHGLRRLAAIESSSGSFDGAVEAITRATGQQVGKRQVEDLAQATAADFDTFYAHRQPAPAASDDLLVLSCDGKGVVMRPDALRKAAAAAAAKTTPKLATRLSKGEKRKPQTGRRGRRRLRRQPRSAHPADVLPATNEQREHATPGPTARNKWLMASGTDDAATVVARMFDEADRRDPEHDRTWVALVDGNNHQIDRIKAEARTRGVTVAIVIDVVHVLEYLWKAAWSFHDEGDPAAEAWVRRHASAVLAGRATRVAGNIRRAATRAGLNPTGRAGVDRCATYLTNKRDYLDYPTALTQGWPIATGVIEGACRHLVKDRMDLTGARWGLAGAETILKLRAIRTNGDWDPYWNHHLRQERQRVHQSRYAEHQIPQAA